jgi:catechol 2,3-dioxygenase-like lactoylglutathione lyase family enzyme
MATRLNHVALVVEDYDPAIAYYVGVLGFVLLEDTDLGGGKRWVVVQPGPGGSSLLLARAASATQSPFVGNQTGGRVFLFLATDDFWPDYHRMTAAGVRFLRLPAEEPYGTVAVFEDLCGNLWDLVQYNEVQSLSAKT